MRSAAAFSRKANNLISVWPNPATDFLNINTGELRVSSLTYISVFDLNGRELLKIPFSERINISSLHEGVYIVVTSMNGRAVGYNRLIKTR